MHVIEALKPQPRPTGLLLDVATDLNLGNVPWQRGVKFTGYGCAGLTPAGLQFCYDEEVEPLDAAVSGSISRHPAFDVAATESCTDLDVDLAWLSGRLDDRWGAFVSTPIAAQLETNALDLEVPTSEDDATPVEAPSLRSEATVLTYAPVSVATGFAVIEAGLASTLHGAVGIIHVTPALLSLAGGDILRWDNGVWRTYTGHAVVADAGYTGAVPDAGTFADGTFWMYGSGPVGYQLGAPAPRTPIEEGLNLPRNTLTARKIAQALVVFEPCSVVAAQVELPDTVAS